MDGKTALVTGGTGGIGKETARALARLGRVCSSWDGTRAERRRRPRSRPGTRATTTCTHLSPTSPGSGTCAASPAR
ncbi:hypothetical protein CLV40_101115 [Actinokineospora auranticolor]|uniref:Uncharacterized protein n=1 Tax=Actinokineospora auranticolor TaxID=155976 RepID=A0A2S6H0C4_9PSEU|nr:hypothetical protein CLV40_101115 [Actinokineospora auranticolor]